MKKAVPESVQKKTAEGAERRSEKRAAPGESVCTRPPKRTTRSRKLLNEDNAQVYVPFAIREGGWAIHPPRRPPRP